MSTDDGYNTDCVLCGSRAYQGLGQVECSNSACVRYKPFNKPKPDKEEPICDQEQHSCEGDCSGGCCDKGN